MSFPENLTMRNLKMKRAATLCAAAAVALMFTACSQAPDTHDADVRAIQNDDLQWNHDFAAQDADKLASHYADDAVLMVPGSSAVSGKDAIHTALKQMASDPAFSLKFQSSRVDVAKSGDLAYTQGS
jgi:ketosteroid isomerase-like protein